MTKKQRKELILIVRWKKKGKRGQRGMLKRWSGGAGRKETHKPS